MKRIHTLQEMEIFSHSKILVCMPHPDDEAVFTSGLLSRLLHGHIATKLCVMTRGEKSTLRYSVHPKHDLSLVRLKEQERVVRYLGIQEYSHHDVGDGFLESRTHEMKLILQKEIHDFRPTHILTLEPDGIYGHPDHIALSDTVRSFHTKSQRVLYATVHPNYVSTTSRHMAKKKFIKPILPEFSITLSLGEMYRKIRTLQLHTSQFSNFFFVPKTVKHFLRNHLITQ